MTQPSGTFEDELDALIQGFQQERGKAELRLISVQRQIEDIDRQIAAARIALDAYRVKYGLPRRNASEANPDLAAQCQGKSVIEMAYLWADTHGGKIVMREMNQFLTDAGYFQNTQQAGATLGTAISRSKLLERIGSGIYRKHNPQ
ncbi:MAG: hypothetical protein Q7O66_16885 [Dehalococcoidia bacterium]|nr:hypothetical protein [Dehalococcoidia bacterium]